MNRLGNNHARTRISTPLFSFSAFSATGQDLQASNSAAGSWKVAVSVLLLDRGAALAVNVTEGLDATCVC